MQNSLSLPHIVLLLLPLLPLAGQATDFSKLYKSVSDSVVMIKTNQYVEQQTEKGVVSSKLGGLGSGVITKENYVLTAAHVVNIADRIEVHTKNGQVIAAKTVSSVPLADLAVLQLIDPPEDIKQAPLGNSDNIDIGAEVFVVGAPYGLSQTLTVGHFSGRRIHDSEEDLINTEFLQTDAPINRGNSGGPMFNTQGEVIGIVSHIRSSSGGSEGLGFAASVNMAKKLFLDNPPPWVGMEYVPMSETLADALNVPHPNGLLVQRVAYGSMADRFGVQPGRIPATINGRKMLLGGDVLIAFGDEELNMTPAGVQKVRRYLNSVNKGGKLELTVYRDGRPVVLRTTKLQQTP